MRKKAKVKQEVLLDHYKLPGYIEGEGGSAIFKKFEIMSREQIKSITSLGHEIACDDGPDSGGNGSSANQPGGNSAPGKSQS